MQSAVIFCLLVITFFGVLASGPAGRDYLERRRAHRDRPLAQVFYLPTSACREPEGEVGPQIDPVLRRVRERRERERELQGLAL